MIRQIFLLTMMTLLLTSCLANKDQSKVVVLKHPQTLDFQRCNIGDWGSEEAYAKKDACVKQWQQQGYIVWGSH